MLLRVILAETNLRFIFFCLFLFFFMYRHSANASRNRKAKPKLGLKLLRERAFPKVIKTDIITTIALFDFDWPGGWWLGGGLDFMIDQLFY